jgi:8-oxo-dGTP diphosphatase
VSADPASAVTGPLVGVSAIVVRHGAVLLGRRRGAHGAGTFAFPGGKPDPGEHPSVTVRRELFEETGLAARSVHPVTWTSDVFADGNLHFVTLHHLVEADGEPEVREPDKVAGWGWYAWDALPEPLFAPAASLIASGWRPASENPR